MMVSWTPGRRDEKTIHIDPVVIRGNHETGGGEIHDWTLVRMRIRRQRLENVQCPLVKNSYVTVLIADRRNT